jgi:cold shock CspA family protein
MGLMSWIPALKRYSHQLGHGFILCEDPFGDVFMSSEDITGGDPRSLDTGDKVTFEVADAPEGKEGRTVAKVS